MTTRLFTISGFFLMAMLVAVLAYSIPVVAQQDERKKPAETLKMTGIGEVKLLPSGTHGAFRTYASEDGAGGRITYALFSSVAGAKNQTEQWLKAAKRVVSRDVDKSRLLIKTESRRSLMAVLPVRRCLRTTSTPRRDDLPVSCRNQAFALIDLARVGILSAMAMFRQPSRAE